MVNDVERVNSRTEIHLLGGVRVTCGSEHMTVPVGSQPLLAFVALSRGRIARSYVAGSLWPNGDDEHAIANLRSALWRLRRAGIDVIDADKWSLAIADDVEVDVRRVYDWVASVTSSPRTHDADAVLADTEQLPPGALDLLPAWHDHWAIAERERIRQLVLHGLEALSARHLRDGRLEAAVAVAARCVEVEPLRETAQRALLRAHLALGNRSAARAAFYAYAERLQTVLGRVPAAEMVRMMQPTLTRLPGEGRRGRTVVRRAAVRVRPTSAVS